MNKSLASILGFLATLCVSSFIAGAYLNSPAAFVLSGTALLPLVGIFAVGVLDYKVGGTHLTLEKRVDHLEKENTGLKEITNALLKITLTHQDGAGRYGGTPKEHKELISQYVSELSKYVEQDFNENLKKDISKLNQQIRDRVVAK